MNVLSIVPMPIIMPIHTTGSAGASLPMNWGTIGMIISLCVSVLSLLGFVVFFGLDQILDYNPRRKIDFDKCGRVSVALLLVSLVLILVFMVLAIIIDIVCK